MFNINTNTFVLKYNSKEGTNKVHSRITYVKQYYKILKKNMYNIKKRVTK